MSQVRPWGQREDETDKAFAAFSRYLDLGPKRSLPLAAKAISKSLSHVTKWSGRHQWSRRAAAYDAESRNLDQDAREVAISQATARHSKLARAVLGNVAAELASLGGKRCQACGRAPLKVNASQLGNLLRTGVDIERTALGLAGTNAAAGTTVNNVTNIQNNNGTSNILLLRDHDSQVLAGRLLARVKSFSPKAIAERAAAEAKVIAARPLEATHSPGDPAKIAKRKSDRAEQVGAGILEAEAAAKTLASIGERVPGTIRHPSELDVDPRDAIRQAKDDAIAAGHSLAIAEEADEDADLF